MHHKTWAALTASHSKATITANNDAPELTQDNLLRMRPNKGLHLCTDLASIDCDSTTTVLGEISLADRALLDGLEPAGCLPRAILTIENLGVFVDLQKPDNICLIFQPGWDTLLSLRWISRFPADIPWYHFGDLDPEGIDIYLHLKNTANRQVDLLVPDCAANYIDSFANSLPNGWSEKYQGIDKTVDKLIAKRKWLEQEVLCFDFTLSCQLNDVVLKNTETRIPFNHRNT